MLALPDARHAHDTDAGLYLTDGTHLYRRLEPSADPLRVAAADPLNLTGILTPGPRVSPLSDRTVAVLGEDLALGVRPAAPRQRLSARAASS